jgi:predicted nucleic acid-binding Zn finger protein
MATTESSASAHQSTTSRIERGRKLFEEHAGEITFLENDVWLVPGSRDGTNYLVNVRLERCDCADFEHRGQPCKHVIAATIADAKSVSCSCCGERVLGRFTTEVTEEDELLSWFEGDLLCAECIRAGFWV